MADDIIRLYHEELMPKGKNFSLTEATRLVGMLPTKPNGPVWTKTKKKKSNEITDGKDVQRDLGISVGNPNCFRYHEKKAPYGKQFSPEAATELEPDWVDSPAKFELSESLRIGEPGDESLAQKAAEKLLGGEGLNHSSWMREIKCDPKGDRAKTKKVYDGLLEYFSDKIVQQDRDWFWK